MLSVSLDTVPTLPNLSQEERNLLCDVLFSISSDQELPLQHIGDHIGYNPISRTFTIMDTQEMAGLILENTITKRAPLHPRVQAVALTAFPRRFVLIDKETYERSFSSQTVRRILQKHLPSRNDLTRERRQVVMRWDSSSTHVPLHRLIVSLKNTCLVINIYEFRRLIQPLLYNFITAVQRRVLQTQRALLPPRALPPVDTRRPQDGA